MESLYILFASGALISKSKLGKFISVLLMICVLFIENLNG